MGPDLWELFEDGKGDDEVAAIIRLGHSSVLPKNVRVVTQFGEIITIRTSRASLPSVAGASEVADIAAGDTYMGPDVELEAANSAELSSDTVLSSDERRPPDVKATGRGVVVGVVDWGFDFAHPDFLNKDGTTRILALWDQRGSRLPNSPEPWGYGVVHDRAAINRALKQKDPYAALGYHPADSDTGFGCHGTHVLSIAAGGGGEDRPTGIAPEADLIVVHNAPWDELDTGRLGDSVTLLEGIDFIARTAGDRLWVINLSMGRHGEQHDGSTLIEQGLDAAIRLAPGRAVCLSAGNYFDKRIHASGQLRPTQERTIIWEIIEGKPTNNQLEFWYSWQDRFEVAVRSPDGSIAARAAIGERSKFLVGGKEVGNVYHRGQEPNNLDNHITIYLYQDAPAGEWEVTLIGTDVIDGRYHAWVERDVSCPRCQSRLRPDDADPHCTTGTICNGRRTLAVGAYNTHDPEMRLGYFSSVGPTRDGRLKPDLCAPGVSVLAARSAPREKPETVQLLTRMSGTSMAAPHVTGTVALMFQAAPRRLRIEETHNLLLQSTRKVNVPEEIPERIGIGFLDVEEAVDAASKVTAAAFGFKQTTVLSAPASKPKSESTDASWEAETEAEAADEMAKAFSEGRADAEFGSAEDSPYQNTFHRIASDITAAFEGGKTGTLNLYDLGIISYGKHQATLHSGTLYGMLNRFTELSSSATSTRMATYLDRVKQRDETLRDDSVFIGLLKDAAKEPEMDQAQDEEFTRQYWEPAKKKAAAQNVKSALGHAVFYDTRIQGGLDQVSQSTNAKLGGSVGQTVNGKEIAELDSLRTFVDERIQRNLRISVYQKKQAADFEKAAQDLEDQAAADPSRANDLKPQAAEKRKKAKQYAANAAALEISSNKTRGPSFAALVESGDLNLYDGAEGKIYLKGKSGVSIVALKPGAAIDEKTPAAEAEFELATALLAAAAVSAEDASVAAAPSSCAHSTQTADAIEASVQAAAFASALATEADGDSPTARLSPLAQARRQRDISEARRNPRPEIRPGTSQPWIEGVADVTESTDDRRSILLWNFDIDGSYLKPEHESAVREAVAWLASRKPAWRNAAGGAAPCRIFVSGFASHTGSREHNEVLARDREESALATFAASMPADLASDCNRGGMYDAFWTDPSVGENARRRAVRIVLQAQALPPPPPIPLDQCGNVTVWINAFIPGTVSGYTFTVPAGPHAGKTAIPCPLIATPVNPSCPVVGYLTDQRSFDAAPAASVRMRSRTEISVSPPALIPHPGFEHVTSGTTEIFQSSGKVTCVRAADMSRCSFSNFRVAPDPSAPLSGNFFITLSVKGAASDPCVNLAADIDYGGEISIFCSPRGGVVEVSFNGKIDSFPAFEMYAALNGVTKTLFRVPPPPGNTVASLVGGASTPITGRARFASCRFAPVTGGVSKDSESALPLLAPVPAPARAAASELVALADQIVGEMDDTRPPSYVLHEMFSRSDALEELATADGESPATAAQIYDSFVYSKNARLGDRLGANFAVLAMPGEPLSGGVEPGDVMLRRGDGSSAHVSIVASNETRSLERALADGLTTESRAPGQYVEVIEAGPFPHESEDRYARQLADGAGRLLNDILLLRATAPTQQVITVNEPAPASAAKEDPFASGPDESIAATDDVTFADNVDRYDMTEIPPVVSSHSITVNGKTLNYTATIGRLPIKRGDGTIEAEMFFVAYTLNGQDRAKRPLTFAFNGGPGSASLWLHIGALGPRKVILQPEGFMPPAPYRIETNPYTLLDASDLVFIDAIGTGFSRAADSQTFEKFWGVVGDIEAFSEFIRLYITRNERWSSPLFLIGESYGTMRAAGIAGYLAGKGISFNGITLLSTVLNYQTLEATKANDQPYTFLLPTFTNIAGYHHKLPPDLAKDVARAREESEKFASGDYALALAKGDSLAPAARQQIIEQMSRFTGLPRDVIDQADLRIDVRKFTHYLLLDQKLRVGRFDGRFTGPDPQGLLDTQFYDPTESATHPPFTSVFNNYLRTELGYKTDMPYYTRAQDADNDSWNWGSGIEGFPDTASGIRQAIIKNPYLKVLVMEGYYDLATPYSAANYTIDHLALPPQYRANVSVATYDAGHMVYLPEAGLKKMKADQAAFTLQSAAPRSLSASESVPAFAATSSEDDVSILAAATREMSLQGIAAHSLGQLPQEVLEAILVRGENDANALTDRVFWAIHPNLANTKLDPANRSQQELRAEWSIIYRRRVKPMIWLRAIISQLDKYRGTLPRDFLLGWMAVESDGYYALPPTQYGEIGYFQIMWQGGEAKENLHITEEEFQKLRTDAEFSLKKGVALAEAYRQHILRTYPSVPDGSELLWRLTKGRHAAAGALKNALDKLLRQSSAPLTWPAVAGVLPDWMLENINATMEFARNLKPFADLVPPAAAGSESASESVLGGATVLSLFGEDTGEIGSGRKQVTPTTDVPWRWMCRIEIQDLINKISKFGSGLLISDCHVLTAAHVVWDYCQDRMHFTMQVAPGRDDSDEPFDSFIPSKVRICPQYKPSNADQWDYALITLDKKIGQKTFDAIKGAKLRYWGASDFGDRFTMSPGDPLTITRSEDHTAGYPYDKGASKLLWTSQGRLHSIGLKGNPNIMYTTADQTAGQSGGPHWILVDGHSCLVGIAIIAGTTMNRALRVTPAMIDNLRAWISADGETPWMTNPQQTVNPPTPAPSPSLPKEDDPSCMSQVERTIYGWGQYKDEVPYLPAAERDKINELANLVVASFSIPGCAPLGKIGIVGHADRDSHGAALEKRVSDARALSVAAELDRAIRTLWTSRGMGPLGAISYDPSPQGAGAAIPDPSNVPVITDRRRNRRVVVTLYSSAPLPSPPVVSSTLYDELTDFVRPVSMGLTSDPSAKLVPAASLPLSLSLSATSGWNAQLLVDTSAASASNLTYPVEMTMGGSKMTMAATVISSLKWAGLAASDPAITGGSALQLPLNQSFLLAYAQSRGATQIAGNAVDLFPLSTDIQTYGTIVFGFMVSAGSVKPLDLTGIPSGQIRGWLQSSGGGSNAGSRAIVIAAFDLSLCGPKDDFQPKGIAPIGPANVVRTYPLLCAWSSKPLASLAGSLDMSRPARSPMDDMVAGGAISNGLYTDMNDNIDSMLSCAPSLLTTGSAVLGTVVSTAVIVGMKYTPCPRWDSIFAHYSLNSSRKSITVVSPRLGRRTNSIGRQRFYPSGGYLPTTVLKVERQGMFDNIHLAPVMNYKGAEAYMAPICQHDCLHIHWRWGATYTDLPMRGWSGGKPYQKSGAPMIPENQTLQISASGPSLTYAPSAENVPAMEWQVFMHHGTGYVSSLTYLGDAAPMLEVSLSNLSPSFAEFYYHNRKYESSGPSRSADLSRLNEGTFSILESM